VVKQSSSGQTYLRTKIERTILAIASMHPQVAGRKIKTFTGTTVMWNKGQKQERRRSGKLKKWKLMLWQSHWDLNPHQKSQGAATGANAAPVASSSNSDSNVEQFHGQEREDKGEERWRKKDERKQEKRARKELKKLRRSGANDLKDLKDLPHRNHIRSQSPRFRSREQRFADERRPRHNRTPPGERRNSSSRYDIGSDYDSFQRERERENDRRRWDLNNARRDPPPDGRRF